MFVRSHPYTSVKATKMFSQMIILTLLSLASAEDNLKNFKRSISSFGLPSWNTVVGTQYPWHTSSFPHGKGGHLGLGATAAHEIAAAITAAKEATAAAVLAHQRVQAARELALIRERVAEAKEAAAQAAIQRSEAAAQVAAAIQKSEALVAAAAAAHKSASVNAVSAAAAHAASHFPPGPWTHPTPVLSHWG